MACKTGIRLPMMKMVAALSAVTLMGLGLVVASGSPASATVPRVTGTVTCPTIASEQPKIDWQVAGDPNYPNETATIVTQSIQTQPALVGQSVQNNSTATGTQQNAAVGTYTMTVQVQWTNHAQGDLVSASSAPVTVGEDCVPPEEPPTEVVAPAAPAAVDECNPPGVTNNVTWRDPLPADTATVQWSESDDGTIRMASLIGDNVTWNDGTTDAKVFSLPADSGEDCPVEPPGPPPSSYPQGNLTVDCTGSVVATLDNTRSTVVHKYYLQREMSRTAAMAWAFQVRGGNTKTVTRHGQPGDVFTLKFKGDKSQVTVPAKCGNTPPPTNPPSNPPATPPTFETGLGGPAAGPDGSTQPLAPVIFLIMFGAGAFLFLFYARKGVAQVQA